MNICFACHRYAPLVGGYETQLRLLAEGLSNFFNVKVVTFKLAGSPEVEGSGELDIYRVKPKLVFFRVPFSYGFLRTLTKLDFDVLHAHGLVPCVSDLSIFYAKFVKKRKVVYTHHFDGSVQDSRTLDLFADFYNKTVGRFSAKVSDAIVATSRSYAETSPVIRPYLDKVFIIPCSVNQNFFRPQPRSMIASLRRRLGLVGKKVVLFVGRIVPYKGLEYLVKALGHVRGVDGDFHLLVVGEGEGKKITDTSGYHQRIWDYVNNNGLKERVRFLGRVPHEELPLYYSLGDVLALPSVMRGEAFGSVLLESLSCGTPVVASNIPGVSDVLKGDNHIGGYVPPQDDYALAKAIVEMAYRKNDVRERCRQFAVNNYSVGKVVEKYVDLYNTLQ